MPDDSSYPSKVRLPMLSAALWVIGLVFTIGCGTTGEQNATQQLVMSDAVDKSVQHLDFRPLSDQKVYLDNSYLRHVKGDGFVNSEYVTSALRQQIVAAGCLIQDSSQDADIIIEARLGVLGSDDHRVTFGVPENNALSSAMSLIPNSPDVPSIPEMAIARRDAREAAAKIVAFAYHRETRKPIWQSGVKHSIANARDTWVLGVGPFQSGTIREDTKLAGSRLKFGGRSATGSIQQNFDRPDVDYTAEVRFDDGWPLDNDMNSSDTSQSPDAMPDLEPPLARPVRIAAVSKPGGEASKESEAAAVKDAPAKKPAGRKSKIR
ncbi:DUF6655 family protein [Planctomycetes bacterium K23_9]|uniref:Uncharacterized protein n=1 Tax=Stieleria marina TaxID=1930275 RepID=A0A517P0X3_9BACT|nr:hypothetical protein K239x_50440 [Planctomycetes bacterium K23_9]